VTFTGLFAERNWLVKKLNELEAEVEKMHRLMKHRAAEAEAERDRLRECSHALLKAIGPARADTDLAVVRFQNRLLALLLEVKP
jgi:hypothetical protein